MTTAVSHGYHGTNASIADLQTKLGTHVVLVGVGLETLLSRSMIAFEVLKWAGTAYLIWLGIQQWRAAGAIDLNTMTNTQSHDRLFKRAVFVDLTNPKSIVFFATLFPQSILPQEPQLMQHVVLGVATIVVDIIVMIGYATLATRIAGWIKRPKQMKTPNKVFGPLFMLIGALLASARHVQQMERRSQRNTICESLRTWLFVLRREGGEAFYPALLDVDC